MLKTLLQNLLVLLPKKIKNRPLDSDIQKLYTIKPGDKVIRRHSNKMGLVVDIDSKADSIWLDDELWSYSSKELIFTH